MLTTAIVLYYSLSSYVFLGGNLFPMYVIHIACPIHNEFMYILKPKIRTQFQENKRKFQGNSIEFQGNLFEFQGNLIEFQENLIEFQENLIEFHGNKIKFQEF